MKLSDLRTLVRNEIADATEFNVAAVVVAVSASIPDRSLRPLINQLLGEFVADIIRTDRRAVMHATDEEAAEMSGSVGRSALTRGPSRRAIAAAAWRRRLDVFVNPHEGTARPKRLGACTAEEVAALADAYSKRAADNAAYAEWYREVHHAMVASRAKTVGDLPARTLRPLLEKAAA